MGAFCRGQDRQIIHLSILQTAISHSKNKEAYSRLLTQDRKKQIKMLFSGNSPSQTHQRYDQIMIKALPLIEKSNSNIQLNTNQQKKKLIVTINQQYSLKSQTNIENKSSIIIETGFIIYENGYYEGDIVRNKQNGLGTFYILSHQIIIINGEWQSGKFMKGTLYKRQLDDQIGAQQKLLYLQLKDGIKNAVVETQNFQYRGSILLEIKNLDEMMTGQGKIIFKKTNATYIGKIKNGLFQTQKGEKSIFTFNQKPLKQIRFEGYYQNGLRQQEGISFFNYQGLNYSIVLEYLNGKPKDEGQIKEYNNWNIARSSQIISHPIN